MTSTNDDRIGKKTGILLYKCFIKFLSLEVIPSLTPSLLYYVIKLRLERFKIGDTTLCEEEVNNYIYGCCASC